MKTSATSSTSFSHPASIFTWLWLAWLIIVSVLTPAHGANTFVNTGALANARTANSATLLPNGKVLICGGLGGRRAHERGAL